MGVHIPNLMFMGSSRASYRTHYSDCRRQPTFRKRSVSGHGSAWDWHHYSPEMLERTNLTRQLSEGEGLAVGKRAMGDYWRDESIR